MLRTGSGPAASMVGRACSPTAEQTAPGALSMLRRTVMIRLALSIALAALLAGCGSATPTAPSSPAVASGAAIQLNQAPADLGCDTIGVDYREVTFRIDPAEAEQVAALAETGQVLRTFWSTGFRGGSAAEKVVVDPAGAVVATDGETLAIPEGAIPTPPRVFRLPIHGCAVHPDRGSRPSLASDLEFDRGSSAARSSRSQDDDLPPRDPRRAGHGFDDHGANVFQRRLRREREPLPGPCDSIEGVDVLVPPLSVATNT